MSLREVIDILLKGKWIIAVITVVAILVSGVISYTFIQPKYESEATVVLHSFIEPTSDMEKHVTEILTPTFYMNQVTSPKVLGKVIEQGGWHGDWTVSELQEQLHVTQKENLITIKLTAQDPDQASMIINSLIAKSRQAVTQHLQQTALTIQHQYEEKMAQDQAQLNKEIQQYNQMVSEKNLPALLLLENIVSEQEAQQQMMLTANYSLLDELASVSKAKQVAVKQTIEKINSLMELYKQSYEAYEEAKNLNEINVNSQFTVISEAIPSTTPVGPTPAVYVVLAGIIGFIFGGFIAFFNVKWFGYQEPKRKKKVRNHKLNGSINLTEESRSTI